MPTLTLADLQTMLASLIASYKSLAATPITDYGINARMVRKHRLEEIRIEIAALSKLEAQLGGTTGTTALGEFGEAQ